MAIRLATLADLDSVVELALAALPDDPYWHYRFPDHDKHPEDHLKFTRLWFRFYLDPGHDDFRLVVAEAPPPEPKESGHATEMVAYALWDVSYLNRRKCGPDCKPQDRS
jgi:hypothetical protein